MKIQFTSVLLMLSFLTLGGCGLQDSGGVKATKDFYFTHINRPVVLSLENVGELSPAEHTLSLRFAKLDRELTSLSRAMDGVFDPTKQAQVAGLLRNFPWVSNAFVLDQNALILGAIPSSAPASVSFSYLKKRDIKPRELYAHIIRDSNGMNFLVARPYIQSGKLVGYLGVSFDPRALLSMVGDASKIFLRTPSDFLWTGNLNISNTPLANIDWAATIDKTSAGSVTDKGVTATWITRYYANIPIIFGIVEAEAKNK